MSRTKCGENRRTAKSETEGWVYELWYAGLRGMTNRQKIKTAQLFPEKEELYYIEETQLRQRLGQCFGEKETDSIVHAVRRGREEAGWTDTLGDMEMSGQFRRYREEGIRLVTYWEADYPERLRTLAQPPYALYVKGALPSADTPAAAIVGARSCSHYGRTFAGEIGELLAEAGVEIISGMARGIDAAAQRGALDGGGASFAVLGCGVDVCYPADNRGLYGDLLRHGGVLSEYAPGTPPLASNFPARNRIISGLADVVLVMEARERSGSLITADMALEQGKDVYALPGNVDSALSRGCNRLIKQGAGIILSPEELLEDLCICVQSIKNSSENKIMLETNRNIVYSCLDLKPRSISEILEGTRLSVPELMKELLALELAGMALEISKGYYVKTNRKAKNSESES